MTVSTIESIECRSPRRETLTTIVLIQIDHTGSTWLNQHGVTGATRGIVASAVIATQRWSRRSRRYYIDNQTWLTNRWTNILSLPTTPLEFLPPEVRRASAIAPLHISSEQKNTGFRPSCTPRLSSLPQSLVQHRRMIVSTSIGGIEQRIPSPFAAYSRRTDSDRPCIFRHNSPVDWSLLVHRTHGPCIRSILSCFPAPIA